MVRKIKEPDASEQAGTETDTTNDTISPFENTETKKTRQSGLFNNPELPQPAAIYELIDLSPAAIKTVKFIRHKKSGLLRAVNITLLNQADVEDLFDKIGSDLNGNVLNDNGVLHCGVVNKLKEVLVKC